MRRDLSIQEHLEASICRDSFYEFVRRFWEIIIPEKPVWNWHIRYLCEELQTIAMRVFHNQPKEYDLVINIPPGTTKSTICSRLFPAWTWLTMPTCRIICGSHNHDLAMDLSRQTRDVVQSDKYRSLFGDICLREDQNTKHYFVNKNGGGRLAVGTGAGIIGFHAHFIVVDDPLDPKRAASDLEIKTANRWLSETLSTRKIDRAITPMILIMQRLHQGDPAAEMLKRSAKSPVRHINLPAEIDEHNRKEVRPRALCHRYEEGLLDPIRLPKRVLEATKEELGAWAYAAQYLQRPAPREGFLFKVGKIEIIQTPNIRFIRVVRFWDKAGSKGKGAYTAGVKIGMTKEKQFYVLSVRRGRWIAGEREEIIKQTAIADGVQCIVGVEQEPGSGGLESAQSTVRNLAGFRVFKIRPTGDKFLRAEPYAIQVDNGNVKVIQAAWTSEYLSELEVFGQGSKFKDQVDASSGAFTLLTRPRRSGGMSHGTDEE